MMIWAVETFCEARGRSSPCGKCVMIGAVESRARDGDRIFQEYQVRPGRDCQIPWHCIDGISPPWGRG